MTTQKEIAFCDCKGYLGLLDNVTGPKDAKSVNSTDEVLVNDDEAEISISQIKKATGFSTNEEDGLDVYTGLGYTTTQFDLFHLFISKFSIRF